MVVCSACGVESESRLKCPKCLRLGLGDHFFCSQDCFQTNYKKHQASTHSSGLTSGLKTGGTKTMEFFKEDNMNTWKLDMRLKPFVHSDCKLPGTLRPWPTTVCKVCHPDFGGDSFCHECLPKNIVRPDYADAVKGESALEEASRHHPIPVYSSEEDLQKIRAACLLGRKALDLAHSKVAVGVTPVAIDDAVQKFILDNNAYPSPLNYYNFPKSCCISVNEIVCHGIPDLRPLRDGDIVNVDITVFLNGFHADLNETFTVGNSVTAEDKKLIKCSHDALMLAIAECKPGTAYRSIGHTIEKHCMAQGFSVVRNYTGHGVGHLFHTVPFIPHYERNNAKYIMKTGHVFTIEPMVNAGTHENDIWPDEWTVSTLDGQKSAQFEHQILVTETGCEVLTARLPDSPKLVFE